MWEYVKGSEADFLGAPEWATISFGITIDKHFGFAEKWAQGARYSMSNNHQGTLKGWIDTVVIIAERRKVDNLQSRVNDASLQQAFDTVQRPAHYNQSGIECIDAIAASMTPAEFQAYLKGNVQKYLWRYQHKNGVEDCRKAQWYLDRLVKELSK